MTLRCTLSLRQQLFDRLPAQTIGNDIVTVRPSMSGSNACNGWHDDGGFWFRSYGNENWEFDEHGLLRLRIASINDLPIRESERKCHWPLGRWPEDHPGLSALGL